MLERAKNIEGKDIEKKIDESKISVSLLDHKIFFHWIFDNYPSNENDGANIDIIIDDVQNIILKTMKI
jgi:hypothetical protein